MVQPVRYKAFISYSHADRKLAEWLHKAIETYRFPRALFGQTTKLGPVPAKLSPVFRDRDELPAAGELNVALYDALKHSEFLIVIASPASARSEWVNEEVRYFKQQHGESRVLVVIADGVPGAEDETECFMPALCHQVNSSGELTDAPAEPLAADLRPNGDGKRLAKLKLIAGLSGLSLNQLVQREATRRQRRLFGLATAATVLAMVMTTMAVLAIRGQIEADRQRAESDGLVEFMLTDLREQLEPVGRLEIFDSVGQRALDYYANQDIDALDADSLGRRARALHLVGEVRDLQADTDGALVAFEEANQTTAELLTRDSENASRIYDHAQSTFWLGYVAWQRNELVEAEQRFVEYNQLANQLVALAPANQDWLVEQSSSLVNLGVMLHYEGRDEEALPYFQQALDIDRRMAQANPDDQEKRWSVAQGHAWLSDALRGIGDLDAARSERYDEQAIYAAMLEQDERDARALEGSVVTLVQLAELSMLTGQYQQALESAKLAKNQVFQLIDADPSNA
ncbi:MAG: TIR domain-containing protein, partial [Pseudomonadota bacterium]